MHVSNLIKATRNEWLVQTTNALNNVNPIVDRIMEDDSVETVIMANEEGVPIFTNVNVSGASNYSMAMKRLGQMAQNGTKEIDIFDEVLVFRIKTKKIEIMVAPHSEFNIIVVQHAREKKKMNIPGKYKN